MPTAVFIKLRDGRRIAFGRVRDADGAVRLKAMLEQWLSRGITLSMANAHGDIADVPPETVACVELDILADSELLAWSGSCAPPSGSDQEPA